MRGVCLFLAAASCTESRLQPAPADLPLQLDDELTLSGALCTDAPRNESFPVKILFVIDTSGSMQFTDPNQQRALAVQQVIERFAGVPGVELGIISFNGRIRVPTSGFTNDIGKLQRAVAVELREADAVTDYQGAFGAAYQLLFEDMRKARERSGSAELSRSKYVVVFFSDGTPQPQCSATGPDPFLVCDFDKAAVSVPAEYYPELEAGKDYNQPYQIADKVRQIMNLAEIFRVGDLRLHTALLYDEEEARIAEEAFGLDYEAGRALLIELAELGHGTFLSFYDGEEINFLSLDYTQIKRPYTVKSFLVTNLSARSIGDALALDSDLDGLADATEHELGTDPFLPDTDGDGFGDLLESRMISRGFDPHDPARPTSRCAELDGAWDSDRDGLANCEERVLGTERLIVDSDADGLPDGIEYAAGLDPADPRDGEGDQDLDGRRSREEVFNHQDPLRREGEAGAATRDHYRYRLEELGQTFDGRTCYQFLVRHIRLVTPTHGGPDAVGWNTLRLWFGQAPQDQPGDQGIFRMACLRARYIPPDLKTPLAGTWSLTPSDRSPDELAARQDQPDGFLIPSAEFEPELHCRTAF